MELQREVEEALELQLYQDHLRLFACPTYKDDVFYKDSDRNWNSEHYVLVVVTPTIMKNTSQVFIYDSLQVGPTKLTPHPSSPLLRPRQLGRRAP